MLVERAAPLLRAQAADPTTSRGALILTRSGERTAQVGGIITRRFASLGLTGLSSRSARVAAVVAFREARVGEEAEEGAARIMVC